MPDLKAKIHHDEIDVLRIISIFFVVLIHTTSKILDYSKFDLNAHPTTLFLNQISRFAVPLFFMISAFVLEHNYSHDLKYLPYLKRRFSKIFLPYLFWSLIYYFLIYPHNSDSLAKALIVGSSSYQLYFIPTLLIFYLIYPLLSRIFKHLNHRIVFLVSLIIQLFFVSIDYYLTPLTFAHPLNVFLLNFMFFNVGILANHHQERILIIVKKYYKKLVIFSVFLSFYIFVEGEFRYFKTQNYLAFSSQWRPSILFYTLTLSSLLYYYAKQIKFKIPLIKKFGSDSFFVFFIHVIFIELIWNYLPLNLLNRPLLSFTLVLIPSYFCAFLSSKIPGLRKLTG
jgi:surface polysaccharide O-acyltransferase-like enzyme